MTEDCLTQLEKGLESLEPAKLKTNLFHSFTEWRANIENDSEVTNPWFYVHDCLSVLWGYYGYLEHAEIMSKQTSELLALVKKSKSEILIVLSEALRLVQERNEFYEQDESVIN
ncbi:hypothetical protein ACTJNK_13565 [Achromobacter anxifer]